jgi:hypothetical protein
MRYRYQFPGEIINIENMTVNLFIAAVVKICVGQANTQYVFNDIGTPLGSSWSTARDISNSGQVVGQSSTVASTAKNDSSL